MAETKTKIIDGITFKVAPFMAIEALKLKAHLMKVVAPAFGHALGSLGGSSLGSSLSSLSIDGEGLAKALSTLMDQLGEEEFLGLVKRVLSQTSAEVEVKGKKIWMIFGSSFEAAFNTVFETKLMTIYPLLAFILEVNFPDFFTRLGDIGLQFQTLLSTKEEKSETE